MPSLFKSAEENWGLFKPPTQGNLYLMSLVSLTSTVLILLKRNCAERLKETREKKTNRKVYFFITNIKVVSAYLKHSKNTKSHRQ
jgi:hypothetical protein